MIITYRTSKRNKETRNCSSLELKGYGSLINRKFQLWGRFDDEIILLYQHFDKRTTERVMRSISRKEHNKYCPVLGVFSDSGSKSLPY